MNRNITAWTIQKVRSVFPEIEFPEYQREPNLWTREDKEKLVDSILRHFDIASIYLYERTDSAFECIDGRQRLHAIMSFVGDNPLDENDEGFAYKIRNEIYEDSEHQFAQLDGLTFSQIEDIASDDTDPQHEVAYRAKKLIDNYSITVILISDVQKAEEFNLQFLRLNLGILINAGEKLHAMIGNMRDIVFASQGLGEHDLLELVAIPTRRFAREVVAAQILCQAFSYKDSKQFTRTRYFDLQKFFKSHSRVDPEHPVVVEVQRTLDWLEVRLKEDAGLLRNRAMTVSVVLLAWVERLFEAAVEVGEFASFLQAFVGRLQWQVENMKNFAVDKRYQYLVDFQRDVTQAAVEKPAVQRRHKALSAEWKRWQETGRIQGDEEYQEQEGQDPNIECSRL